MFKLLRKLLKIAAATTILGAGLVVGALTVVKNESLDMFLKHDAGKIGQVASKAAHFINGMGGFLTKDGEKIVIGEIKDPEVYADPNKNYGEQVSDHSKEALEDILDDEVISITFTRASAKQDDRAYAGELYMEAKHVEGTKGEDLTEMKFNESLWENVFLPQLDEKKLKVDENGLITAQITDQKLVLTFDEKSGIGTGVTLRDSFNKHFIEDKYYDGNVTKHRKITEYAQYYR
jgi:hypothetical protein